MPWQECCALIPTSEHCGHTTLLMCWAARRTELSDSRKTRTATCVLRLTYPTPAQGVTHTRSYKDATFRVAHYEGWHTIIYVLYFVPLAMLAVLLDRWHNVIFIGGIAIQDPILSDQTTAGFGQVDLMAELDRFSGLAALDQ